MHDKSAFGPAPGLRKEDGSIDRTGNIGGQPFVLTTWNDDEVIKEALNVVKWWLNPETQKTFVANGGQSGLHERDGRSRATTICVRGTGHMSR